MWDTEYMRILVPIVLLILPALLPACAGSTPTPLPTPTPTVQTHRPLPTVDYREPVRLPADEGAHLAPVEWWYFNGHLEGANGREYSFHFVTFLTIAPDGQMPLLLQLSWADHRKGDFITVEKPSLAGGLDKRTSRFSFQVEDWSMAGDGSEYRLHFTAGEYSLDLDALPLKPAVLHHETGVVDMGKAGKTYYYTRPRLALTGTLTQDGAATPVTGLAWMDHQWGDFTVAPIGWDWASIQLDDGSELMYAGVWDSSNREAIASYVTYVPETVSGPADAVHLAGSQARWSATGTWTSPGTNVEYPQGWTIAVDSLGLELELVPKAPDAEFANSVYVPPAYWEGAVTVSGTRDGEKIGGKGFVELVGYDDRELPGPPDGP